MPLILYSADGCHLCEQAKRLLAQIGVEYRVVDIALDDDLVARFGVRIPVIVKSNGEELGWPFSAESIAIFME
ncbi:glutaredoxin family protein [Motilimonas pumila]|uniref:Glutaredoxin family protein n=1 Tax=Motilimonas pumila TaxID=2303987 RepID=A0A418YFI3_9GAMM|nr:glutaredoxin family protein [Motilimonas pumila]RJG48146.1 glutaredoxin family protein [Motilimonas pumila]